MPMAFINKASMHKRQIIIGKRNPVSQDRQQTTTATTALLRRCLKLWKLAANEIILKGEEECVLEGKLGLWNQSTQLRFGLRINEGGSFPTFLYTRITEGKKESIFCENYSLWRGKIDDKNSRCSRSVYTLQHPKWNFSNCNWMWLFPVENSAHLNNTCDFFQEDVVGEIQGMFSFFEIED